MSKSSTYCREGCDIYSSWLNHEGTIEALQSQLAGAEQELICLHIAIDRAVEKNKVLCGKQLELQERNQQLQSQLDAGKGLLARCLTRITFLEKRTNIPTLEGDELRGTVKEQDNE